LALRAVDYHAVGGAYHKTSAAEVLVFLFYSLIYVALSYFNMLFVRLKVIPSDFDW
jgi:hypothetical protein